MKNNFLDGLKKSTKSNLITLAMCFAFFAVVTAMIMTGNASRHMKSLLVPICVNIILTVSLNLVIGFLGELSLGHAGFMSVGAYAGCIFSIYLKELIPAALRFPLAILFGGICAAIFGFLVGIPVLRLKGDYLAIVTLAFGEILRSVIINVEFLGGASGLKGTPQDATFNWGFIWVIITLVMLMNLVDSKHGRAIMALRDNTIAASAVGINTNKYKLIVFTVSAFFAGVAGVIYGHNYSILTAGSFDYNRSIEILVMVVLGGIGNIRGSVISATLITILPEMLRGLRDYRMLIYSVVLITMMLLGTSEKFMLLRYKLSPKKLLKRAKAEVELRKEEN